jgi:AraC-like DNA-binding protein
VETEFAAQRPGPAVAPLVERYVGYRMLGFPAGVHRGLPSRHLTFIVSIGPPVDVVAQCDGSQSPQQYRCVVGGLQASPALIAHDGYQEGVALELTPLGARALLGVPAGALWSTSAELDDVVRRSLGTELWERLQATTTWPQRFAVCDQVLSRLVRHDVDEPPPELQQAWRMLVASDGLVPIADIAEEVGWSRQHLGRRFRDELGLSPKLAGRVVRFERARQMLQATPPFVTIAQVAATCGYYDQAHLTRDFVELAGCPPGRWLAEEELPSFQDDEAVQLAG